MRFRGYVAPFPAPLGHCVVSSVQILGEQLPWRPRLHVYKCYQWPLVSPSRVFALQCNALEAF
jgi:hypothetical protein